MLKEYLDVRLENLRTQRNSAKYHAEMSGMRDTRHITREYDGRINELERLLSETMV